VLCTGRQAAAASRLPALTSAALFAPVLAVAVLAVAGLAGCATGPGLSRHRGGPAAAIAVPRSVQPVVVARGRIEGRLWRILVDPGAGDPGAGDPGAGQLCAGEARLPQQCASLRDLERSGGLAVLSGASVDVRLRHPWDTFAPPTWNALFGTVRPDVTSIVLRLSGGSRVRLRPVAAVGWRWVGLVLRPGQAVARAIAYSGRTELGYSVPFYGGLMRPGTYFVTWLRPGQRGPASAEKYIAAGGRGTHSWNALVLAGPWGYCGSLMAPAADEQRQACWPPAALRAGGVILWLGSPPRTPSWVLGTAGPAVAYLRLTQAAGGELKVPAAVVSGQRFFAIRLRAGTIRWAAYSAAGRELYSGSGPASSVGDQHAGPT
jgi:hypothetical protein